MILKSIYTNILIGHEFYLEKDYNSYFSFWIQKSNISNLISQLICEKRVFSFGSGFEKLILSNKFIENLLKKI